jgi:hypothetical protein
MSEPIANVDMANAWDGEEGDQWTQFADEFDKSHHLHFPKLQVTREHSCPVLRTRPRARDRKGIHDAALPEEERVRLERWRGQIIDRVVAATESEAAASSAELPEGWTIERGASGDESARLLDAGSVFVVLHSPMPGQSAPAEAEPIAVDLVISFTGLCLARAGASRVWLMGEIGDDDLIVCWGDYGTDLELAIHGL